MTPRNNKVITSTAGYKAGPKDRYDFTTNPFTWLEDKKLDDGAEGLWRVHDDLYDLNDFINVHPGGRMWIECTKGTDITEAFEVHHISTAAENLLPKFHVRKANVPRNSPYTFHPNGFYRTLKKNVREMIHEVPMEECVRKSALVADALVIGTFTFAAASCYFWSYLIGLAAAYCLTSASIIGHNYLHRKDNFRMYYLDFSGFSYIDWRISHSLSHHLHTNSIWDLEISMFEPVFQWLPKKKSALRRTVTVIASPLIWFVTVPIAFIIRIIRQFYTKRDRKTMLIPLSVLLAMYIFGGQSIAATVGMWIFINIVGSLQFSYIGLNTAHHHPDIFHDGDKARDNKDWGIIQLDAIIDRISTTGSDYLVLTNFGDHGLHHMFPTMDHSALKYIYPVFEKTAKEFNVDLRFISQFDMVLGQLKQLARTTVMETDIDLLKYKDNKKFVKINIK